MSQRFQSATLVSSPSYPNSVVWSDENLVAAASGHLVTILNPAALSGPRSLITLSSGKPFPIGVIDRNDLLSPCMLPTCLSREAKPCARSISWSPIGFAPNAGCLLAVCTTEGHVKIYRQPYCEISAEWVEVLDISEMLCTYLASVNFFEQPELLSSGIADVPTNKAQINHSCDENQSTSVSRKEKRQRIQKALTAVEAEPGDLEIYNTTNALVIHDSGRKHAKQAPECCTLPLITMEQFASRSRMLASLIVAWSPIFLFTAGVEEPFSDNIPGHCSLLAVGGKSGRISFWRFCQPPSYANKTSGEPITASFIGLLEAHDCWITAMSWELFGHGSSDQELLLATGSSNGSIKIWRACANELMKPSENHLVPFYMLKEVASIDFGTVSVVSIVVPLESSEMLLAIGQGSGSLQVWIGDLISGKFEKTGCFNAHEHILMGLAWAFGGKCLYSCSQDGAIRGCILQENMLREIPIPTNIHGRRASDVRNSYDLCFGVAVSPGNLAMAVARSFDSEMLNPMYEARVQKAAVEFLWIGGQQLDLTFSIDTEDEFEPFPGLSEGERITWNHNILWSFKQYEHRNKPLVIWDIVAALLAFRHSVTNYDEDIILQWLRTLFGSQFEVSCATSSYISKFLPKLTSRQLHILNVIGRHVFLKNLKEDETNSKEQGLKVLDGVAGQQNFWLKLVGDSENELRERLLCLNVLGIMRSESSISTNSVKARHWTPVGLGQMVHWFSLNVDNLKDHVKPLAEEVKKIKKSSRFQCIFDDVENEKCSYCSAAVSFDSAEVALCEGQENGDGPRHPLARCAISMHVCPITPTWFCICCHRNALHLAPPALFSLPKYPLDLSDVSEPSFSQESAKPLCPFCGILLQRKQPDFLLSPSPV